jgi:hypothetical protein
MNRFLTPSYNCHMSSRLSNVRTSVENVLLNLTACEFFVNSLFFFYFVPSLLFRKLRKRMSQYTKLDILHCIMFSTQLTESVCSVRQVSLRKWSSMKVAKVLLVSNLLISLFLAITDLIYWYTDSADNRCIARQVYYEYISYFLHPAIVSFIPLIILPISGYKTSTKIFELAFIRPILLLDTFADGVWTTNWLECYSYKSSVFSFKQ